MQPSIMLIRTFWSGQNKPVEFLILSYYEMVRSTRVLEVLPGSFIISLKGMLSSGSWQHAQARQLQGFAQKHPHPGKGIAYQP